jgi:hypothetical protein
MKNAALVRVRRHTQSLMRDIRSLELTNVVDVTQNHATQRAQMHHRKIGLLQRDTPSLPLDSVPSFLRTSGRIRRGPSGYSASKIAG